MNLIDRYGSPAPADAPILGGDKPYYIRKNRCCRCGGSGIYSQFHGVCYRCAGRGIVEHLDIQQVKLYTPEQVAKLDAAKAKKAAAKQAKLDAARALTAAAFNTTYADLLATIPAEWLGLTGPDTLWAQFHGYTTDALVAEEEGLGYKDDFRPKAPSAITIVRDIVLKGRRFGSINAKQADLLTRLIVDGKAALVTIAERVAAKAVQAATSQFVGTEGGKVAVDVTVTKLGKFQRTSFDGRREETVTVVTFADAAGNLLVTKTPTFGYDLTLGQTGTLTGTVKAHSTYQDVKQTQVIRPKLVAR